MSPHIPQHYVLDEDGEAVPEPDLLAWGAWLGEASRSGGRHLGNDTVNGLRVSTVFLGMCHNHARYREPNMAPTLWETMVFDERGGETESPWHHYQDRYDSREAALAGHAEVVRRLREGLPPPD